MVRIGDGSRVSDETWAHVRTEFGDDEIAGLLYTIGLIGFWNVLNVAVEFPAGAQLPKVN
jgi:alkylhydroperoxidase family enzyme